MPVAGTSMRLNVTSVIFARSIAKPSARRTFTSSNGGTVVLNAMYEIENSPSTWYSLFSGLLRSRTASMSLTEIDATSNSLFWNRVNAEPPEKEYTVCASFGTPA